MNFSPTPAESAALRVANAAVRNSSSPNSYILDTAVFALGSAGLLQSPESAAELNRWRERTEEAEIAEGQLRGQVRGLKAYIAELEAGREALAARLRAGQRWQQGRTPALVAQDLVSQDELRAMFGIPLAAPWDEDPCRPCGCPKRFERHADGCPTQAASAEDPHDSPLHHTYAIPRDLPEVTA